jgi:hypothetical protein
MSGGPRGGQRHALQRGERPVEESGKGADERTDGVASAARRQAARGFSIPLVREIPAPPAQAGSAW